MTEPTKEKQTRLKFTLPSNDETQELNAAFGTENTKCFETPTHDGTATKAEKLNESILLDPDHPLLAQFQKNLKQHLEHQIEHLKGEVFELENGAKKKNAMRNQLGLETYENQQTVNKQQRQIEICVQELDEICAATEEMELELDEAKRSLAEKRLEVLEYEKKGNGLIPFDNKPTFESLNLLINQMKSWEEEMESDLTINQRVYEKTQKDRRQLATEKRQLDAFIYKLMTETWRLEEELSTMDMHIRVKEEERERLADAVVASNIDLETIATEHRCLLHSWNSLVVAISNRDKNYTASRDELQKLQNNLRSLSAEVDQTKRLCEKEMGTNERLVDFKCRIQTDVDTTARNIESEKKKCDHLESKTNCTQNLIDQTEADIKLKTIENAQKKYELDVLIKECEKLLYNKAQVDEQILKMLEEQFTNNKAAKYLHKLVREVKENNRNLEITLAKVENSNANALMEIEAQKGANEETQRFLNEVLKQLNNLEDQLKALHQEEERLQFYASRKQRDFNILTHKLEVAISKQGGVEVSPEELKILTLEKNIEEIEDTTKKLQTFWLRQQGFVVNLSHQRQEQINDLSMLKKQLQLLIQKNLRINDDLVDMKTKEDKLNRLISSLQNRVVIVNEQISKKKGNKTSMEKDTDLIQSDYSGKLQDAEMESIKIESDIADIEEDKVTLSNDLVDLNREALAWERKIQMAIEAKKAMEKEKGEGGEVGTMILEIHRMQVRYSQLKKAQDKLIHDLDHCVTRRDVILTVVEAREKREKGASEKTRINFQRKLDDMRNRYKQLENDVETLNKRIEAANEEERRLIKEITITQQDTDCAKRKTETIKDTIEETKTERQRNLELLVLKQKKLKVYSELSKGRKPFLAYRADDRINAELNKQKELNNKLSTIIENLLIDFPQHKQVITRIYNTLKLPILHLYK
ncbi:hypothetical protein RN001_013086 [Aquatica leii]|uniref:Coiled-coil domain-containing protein 40 n=1 Tax=Aquatica leii TaxID=1421715 RepID=A0AAN7P3W6_9COLE|nr:hypothetical protein RN001_013086 [Aquatica leii]